MVSWDLSRPNFIRNWWMPLREWTLRPCPPFSARLWKLHGSVNWAWRDERKIVRVGMALNDSPAAIYPSDSKYEESRRVPFVVLHDRLRRALNQPETLLLIAGYSFQDAHLNEVLFDAIQLRERSEFIVFCYSEILSDLANRALQLQTFRLLALLKPFWVV